MAAARLKRSAAALLVVAGFWESGQGAYIHVKAELAQVLMARAWSETRTSGRKTRPWHWADTWPVARLQAPEHGIEQVVLNGETGNVLAFGPGGAVSSSRGR